MCRRLLILAMAALLSGYALHSDTSSVFEVSPRPDGVGVPVDSDSKETEPADPESFLAEELIRQYMEENSIPSDQFWVGYYNTATKEEAYINGDIYQEPASMYKVALCMYWAEKVSDGTMTWDDCLMYVPLELLVKETIVNSSNSLAYVLIGSIGSFEEYRRAVIPFYGVTGEKEQDDFCRTTALTARQMIHALKLLYAEQERYPKVLEYMSQSRPTEYFNFHPQPWKVAHKYGYWDVGPILVNDCGVIYTQEPFLLVVMTKALPNSQEHMAALCRLLGEYTEGQTNLSDEEEQVTGIGRDDHRREEEKTVLSAAERENAQVSSVGVPALRNTAWSGLS